MHELNSRELKQALEYAKSIDEDNAKRMMIQFEIDQPLFFQTIFHTFPTIIAERNQDLAHLFMDLCFDISGVYKKAFGNLPKFKDDPTWMERQAGLLDKELKPLMQGSHLNAKRSEQIKTDFYTPKDGEILQSGLLDFLHQSADLFLQEHDCDESTIEMFKAMLFVVVRLFTNLYTRPSLQ